MATTLNGEPAPLTVYAAARSGDDARLRDLLASASPDNPVDAFNEDGFTPLHAAAAYGHVSCVQLLLEHGADASIHGVLDRRTALHHAACFGRPEVLEILLGVDSAAVEARDGRGCTPLHLAAAADESACVALLIRAGADIEAKAGASRCMPLHLASGSGATGSLQILLDAGANICVQDDNGCSALHVAAVTGNPDAITNLILAARGANRLDELVAIMDTEDLRTALHKASICPRDCVDSIPLLLDAGADVDARDAHGFTPLHLAASENLSGCAASLLAHGAGANSSDNVDGATPLAVAARGWHLDVATVLVSAGGHDGSLFEGAECPLDPPMLSALLPAARRRLATLRAALDGSRNGNGNGNGWRPQGLAAADPSETLSSPSPSPEECGGGGGAEKPPAPPPVPLTEALEWAQARSAFLEAAFALQGLCGGEARAAAAEWREARRQFVACGVDARPAQAESPAEGGGTLRSSNGNDHGNGSNGNGNGGRSGNGGGSGGGGGGGGGWRVPTSPLRAAGLTGKGPVGLCGAPADGSEAATGAVLLPPLAFAPNGSACEAAAKPAPAPALSPAHAQPAPPSPVLGKRRRHQRELLFEKARAAAHFAESWAALAVAASDYTAARAAAEAARAALEEAAQLQARAVAAMEARSVGVTAPRGDAAATTAAPAVAPPTIADDRS